MALETATYISDLVVTNPTGGDPRSELDDHLRLVKSTLQATFPEGSAPIYGLRSGTNTATTSGTSVAFTGIPSWVKRITVMFNGFSTNNASTLVVQIGDSGGIETAGYTGSYAAISSSATTLATSLTNAFAVNTTGSAAGTISGAVHLELLNAATNTWTFSGVTHSSIPQVAISSGVKSLSATLDRLLVITNEGHTFDAGSVNITYE